MRGVVLAVALSLAGCFTPEPKDPSSALDKCAAEARAAYQTGDSVEEAMRKFEECKRREGIE